MAGVGCVGFSGHSHMMRVCARMPVRMCVRPRAWSDNGSENPTTLHPMEGMSSMILATKQGQNGMAQPDLQTLHQPYTRGQSGVGTPPAKSSGLGRAEPLWTRRETNISRV